DLTGNYSGAGSFDQYSVGAFATGRVIPNLLVGAGVDYSHLRDELYDSDRGRRDDYDQWQGYVAVQYWLWKQIFIKNVVGYGLANESPGAGPMFQNIMVSERVRLEYLF
ncbi:MAG: hypothetical protein FWD17_09435, partial [Polyangiaceae bacterium]|nr:hypothetical protein [Polyangiaceae bacterium]